MIGIETKQIRVPMKYLLSVLAASALLMISPEGVKAAGTIDPAKIEQIENYLNNLGTARARFVQTTHNGTQLVGTFYLDRPGKLRFEYDDPVKDFVVADGFFIYFYDAESGEQSNAPIGQTLADFILRDELDFGEDITVKSYKDKAGLIQVELVQTADPEAGELILGFDKDPFSLKKWRVIDAQDLITEIELFYLKTDIKHPDGIFVYKDPKSGQSPSYND
ncbi:MAG: outer membrane lipocarrier LolA family protein [Micavibrio sp.]|nr:outer membrane lipocarrier LolA family protein [Micavibrio sp.]|tara:strand:- start:1459 stop:2121 length:663 start_codon:yes stop_codon:yes gene_type:complete